MRTIAIAALLATAAAQGAALDVNGISGGSTPTRAQLETALGVTCYKDTAPDAPVPGAMCHGMLRVEGCWAKTETWTDKAGAVEWVHLGFLPECFPAFDAAARKKWGKPTGGMRATAVTAYGMKLPVVEHTWDADGWRVTLTNYAVDATEGWLELRPTPAPEKKGAAL